VVLHFRMARDPVLDRDRVVAEHHDHRYAAGSMDVESRAAGTYVAHEASLRGVFDETGRHNRVAHRGRAAAGFPGASDLLYPDRMVVQPDLGAAGLAILRHHYWSAVGRADAQSAPGSDDADATLT